MSEKRFEIKEHDKQSFSPEQKELVDEIKEITELQLRNIPESHGIEHTKLVEGFAHYLATQEGANVFEIAIAAWLHDWGRVGEKERREKNTSVPHAKISRVKSQRMLLGPLLEEGKLNSGEYQRILKIIETHSDLPGEPMLEKKIIRDADRLSRMGAIGLCHLMEAGEENKLPLYKEGRPILRSPDPKSVMDVQCVIDDINYCIDWASILETKAARKLVEEYHLVDLLQEFLKTFAKYKNQIRPEILIKWVSEEVGAIRVKRAEIEEKFKTDKIKCEKELLKLEDPGIFNENRLKKFLARMENNEILI
ncbi:MAG: HD domain-containing protein [Patescibacteria group bacterium]|nr:HD domain-containing protein [Patescibacteria group bacterium]MDD5491034.1 HD domain-containing protein [Patescibacteria group bacterium]